MLLFEHSGHQGSQLSDYSEMHNFYDIFMTTINKYMGIEYMSFYCMRGRGERRKMREERRGKRKGIIMEGK